MSTTPVNSNHSALWRIAGSAALGVAIIWNSTRRRRITREEGGKTISYYIQPISPREERRGIRLTPILSPEEYKSTFTFLYNLKNTPGRAPIVCTTVAVCLVAECLWEWRKAHKQKDVSDKT